MQIFIAGKNRKVLRREDNTAYYIDKKSGNKIDVTHIFKKGAKLVLIKKFRGGVGVGVGVRVLVGLTLEQRKKIQADLLNSQGEEQGVEVKPEDVVTESEPVKEPEEQGVEVKQEQVQPEDVKLGGNINQYKEDIKYLRKLLTNKKLTDNQKQQYLKKIDSIKLKIEKENNKDKINKCKEHIKNLQKILKNNKTTEKQKQQCNNTILNHKLKIKELLIKSK